MLFFNFYRLERYYADIWLRFKWWRENIFQRGNMMIGLSLWYRRRGVFSYKYLVWYPRWKFGWVRLDNLGGVSWYLASARLVVNLYVLYSRPQLLRELWVRYRGHSQRGLHLRRRSLIVTDIRRRQLIYLKWIRMGIRYILNIYYRTYRLARYLNVMGATHWGWASKLSWSSCRLPHLLRLLKVTAHEWEGNWLITQGFVLINGCVCKDINYELVGGEYIQLVMGDEFFRFQGWVRWVYHRRWRLQLRGRGRLTSRYALLLRRVLPRRAKWIFRTFHDVGDIAKNIDIDFTGGSFIILYKPFLLNHFWGFYLRILEWHFWRVYSWNYY